MRFIGTFSHYIKTQVPVDIGNVGSHKTNQNLHVTEMRMFPNRRVFQGKQISQSSTGSHFFVVELMLSTNISGALLGYCSVLWLRAVYFKSLPVSFLPLMLCMSANTFLFWRLLWRLSRRYLLTGAQTSLLSIHIWLFSFYICLRGGLMELQCAAWVLNISSLMRLGVGGLKKK